MKRQRDRTGRSTRLPPFTQAFVDRYGTPRFYLRKKGIKPVALPGLPWSPEFMAARDAALGGQWELPKAGTQAGTVDAAVIGYLASDAFKALSPGTRVERRRILEKIRKEHGAKRADMPSEAVALILDGKTPAALRNWRKALRGLVDYCMSPKVSLMKTDPLAAIKLPKMKKTGCIHAWDEGEIAAYREHWKPGTRQRRALELLLNTGHARAEAVRMGRQHINRGASYPCRGRRPA